MDKRRRSASSAPGRESRLATTATEAQHALSVGLQALPKAEILARLLEGHLHAAAQVAPAVPAIAAAAEAAADALAAGNRLAYAGAGSAGLMALSDALELFGTFGIPPDQTPMLFAGGLAALIAMTGDVEDAAADGARDVAAARLGPGDVAICVSASGTTPYTLAAAEAARARGVRVIGIANVAESALLAAANLPVLLDTGPELVAGSTRLGAGDGAEDRAQHALDPRRRQARACARRLHGQPHRRQRQAPPPGGAHRRGSRGRSEEEAAEALAAAGGAVKPAILIAAGAAGRAEAERLLTESGGHLGPALSALRDG